MKIDKNTLKQLIKEELANQQLEENIPMGSGVDDRMPFESLSADQRIERHVRAAFIELQQAQEYLLNKGSGA